MDFGDEGMMGGVGECDSRASYSVYPTGQKWKKTRPN